MLLGHVIVLTFRQTYKPFCRYYSTALIEVPIPEEREEIKKKQCIKLY